MASNKERVAELLRDLEDNTVSVLTNLVGLDADQAAQAAAEISDRLVQSWGKQHIYIPADMSRRVSARDRQIWEQFNGRNHSDLAREFGISTVWVYAIVRRARAAHEEQLALGLSDQQA